MSNSEENGWRKRKAGESQPEYGDLGMVSFEFNFKGALGEFGYYDGEQWWIDHVDPDMVSLLEIKHMVLELGVVEPVSVYWLKSGKDINYGLIPLKCDNDVVKMVEKLPNDKRIVLFLQEINKTGIPADDRTEMSGDHGNKNGQNSQHNIGGNVNEDGSEEDDDYYPGTDSDDSIVFEDDQVDPFDDEDIRDRLYKDDSADNGQQPTPVRSARVTRSKTKAGKKDSITENEGQTISEGGNGKHRRKFRDFQARTDMDRPEFEVGMFFQTFDVFREACRRHSINERRAIIFEKNDKERVYCVCKVACGFRIHARHKPKVDQVQIVQCNSTHTCGVVQDLRAANRAFIAQKYLERFRIDLGWSTRNLIHTVQTDLALSINRVKAYRAKVTAMEMIHGEYGQQFAKLYEYKGEIEAKNPGSTVVIVHQRLIFERIYICLDACKRGFKEGCRKVVCVDGCFLRGVPGWQLLSAVGLDANDCMYPIAWAIVQTENTETWEWFLALVATDLDIESGWDWTFMSDKQKGLLNVMEQMLPLVEHRCCVRHLYVNFSSKFGRSKHLKDLIWGASRATYKAEYNSWMDLIRKESSKYQPGQATPYDWLVGKSVEQWCKAFYRTQTKSEIALNNVCECWNKYVLEPRSMPILSCLEGIRSMMMQRLYKKKAEMSRWEGKLLCQKPQKKLDEYKKYATMCTEVLYNGVTEYQVRFANRQFVVDLGNRTCACGRWQLSGIPCSHAISCILFNKESPEKYVDKCYHVETGLRSYSYAIHPLNDSSQWEPRPELPLTAPTFDAPKRGRKKVTRRKEAWELEVQTRNKEGRSTMSLRRKGATMTCTTCKKPGHNRRSCAMLRQAAGGTDVAMGGDTTNAPDAMQGSPRATRLSQIPVETPTPTMNFMPTPGMSCDKQGKY